MGGINKESYKKEGKTSDVDDHIANRYDIKKRLGKGAYGIVWKAVDTKTKEIVAVKKIFEAFRNQTDAQRTFREIMFLQAFKGHPNIITLRGLHKATNNKDIYLIFDFMDTDLHHVIKRGTVLKDIHKRYIMYQLFRATQYLHSGNVIHRDQKPSNVLINAECKIKIADFGLARSLTHSSDGDDEGVLTDYVATRWYRAPEILVASKNYTKGVDMWSLGCILGEMLLGKPLFPGSSTVNQMERILAVLPQPTQQEVINMCSGYGKGLLDGYHGPKTSLKELVNSPCENALDLLIRLLVFDPAKRLTASDALLHPYVASFVQGREQILDKDVTPPLDDDVQLTVADYRNKLYEMIESARIRKKLILKPEQSPEEKSSSRGSEEMIKQNKPVTRSSFTENRTRVYDLRPLECRRQITEDKRCTAPHQVRGAKATWSDCSVQKTGSPQSGVQRVVSCWPDRQRVLATKPQRRYEGNGSGDGFKSSQPPFREALAQVKEKLRRAQAINAQLGPLPKVVQKRDIATHMSSSPSHLARYSNKLLSSPHANRNLLKH